MTYTEPENVQSLQLITTLLWNKDVVANIAALKQMLDDLIAANAANTGGTFVGEVRAFAGFIVPSGWLMCNGAAVSRTAYAALYQAIGQTYGVGDGATTFNLPRLNGRVIVGTGANGLVERSLGDTGGVERVVLSVPELPPHGHPYLDKELGTYVTSAGASGGSFTAITNSTPEVDTSRTTSNAGGGASHENMPPFLALNYIIKA